MKLYKNPKPALFHFLATLAMFVSFTALSLQAQTSSERAGAAALKQKIASGKERRVIESPSRSDVILSAPESGVIDDGKYSKNKEAENLMNEGESYFRQGDFEEALNAYQKALKLDPNLYEAALFSGDAYVQTGSYDDAEAWYQKAIAINPNRETAYRCSAKPLMEQERYDLARDRFIEAYIVEPYNRFPVAGLIEWAQTTNTGILHPAIDVPEIKYDEKGNARSSLNINPAAEDGSAAWLAYVATRELWHREKYAKTFPKQKNYRRTLAEEAEALRGVIRAFKEKKAKNPNERLSLLSKLNDEGFLEPFILLALPDEGVAQDYPEYLKQNRDRLRQYVLKYVIKK
ncbi:MAG: tetratricopeptide repeat protein [Acidobacteriota bacterium]|nr:tetratricopeptide repeat protein [Acidobacteriota bacterium]